MDVKSSVFREYDIRGIAGEELTEDAMLLIGKAYAAFLQRRGAKKTVVGFDNRLSSESFSKAFVSGVLSSGINVINLGLCTSPMMYFARKHLSIEGGAMITASHNPKEYNGIKLAYGDGCIYGEDIREIREIIRREDFSSGTGREEKHDIMHSYLKSISDRIKLFGKIRVVLDCGNGTASIAAPRLLRDLGCDLSEIHCESDGNFPNHHPDPTMPSEMKDLVKKVLEEKADLGIGIDGDADRIGVVDDRGNMVWGDMLMVLFAREVLSKNPGAKILMEVKCSQALWEEIEKHGGKPIMSRTGHSIIEAKMHEEKALLAGEMSGHIYFSDEYFGFDDAIYAAARLLRIVSSSKMPLSEMLSSAPKYFSTPEIRIDCDDNSKFEIVEVLKGFFREHYRTIEVDGVRVIFPDGWALVRASNTEAKLILRMEAKTLQGLKEIEKALYLELRKFPELKSVSGLMNEISE